MLSLFADFAATHGLTQNSTDANTRWRYDPANPTAAAATYIAMSVKTFKLFVNEKLIPALPQIEANYAASPHRRMHCRFRVSPTTTSNAGGHDQHHGAHSGAHRHW